MTSPITAPRPQRKPWLLRLLPVMVIAVGIYAAYALGLVSYLSLANLADNKAKLVAFIQARPVLAGLGFACLYALMVALSLPVASGLTLISGLLFGAWYGFLWAFLGAMMGATLTYLMARYAFGDLMHAKAGSWVAKLERGFHENEFSFMLLLRLIIIVPFFALNVAAGLLNVRLSTYVIATAIGIIPATLLKTFLVGGEIRDAFLLRDELPQLGSLLADWRLWVAMTALGLVAITPLIAKRFAGKRVEELQS